MNRQLPRKRDSTLPHPGQVDSPPHPGPVTAIAESAERKLAAALMKALDTVELLHSDVLELGARLAALERKS